MLVRSVGRDQRPWNKGSLIRQKRSLQSKHVWSISVRLEIARSWRDLVIFNLAIDSKLRACDLVTLRLDDICSGAKVRHRATIVQKKTGRPVQFEITKQSRSSVEAWLPMLRTTGGLESTSYGTRSMRRTKAAQIDRKIGNLRAVQFLPGHTKLESTVRYLGIELNDALNIAGHRALIVDPPASCRWSLAHQRRSLTEMYRGTIMVASLVTRVDLGRAVRCLDP